MFNKCELLRKLEIQSKTKVIEFINSQSVGRMATIDAKGYPQIIPMIFCLYKYR